MKILDIKQNTPEWEELRYTKIGASDAPIIMGKSPFKKPDSLLREKLTRQRTYCSPAMRRGQELEPIARLYYSTIRKELYTPEVVQHDNYPWMIASLDGLSKIGNILEIKCPLDNVFYQARGGKIPEYWLIQVQHQMCVADVGKATIFVYSQDNPEESFAHQVKRNKTLIDKMVKMEEAFFQSMVKGQLPEEEKMDLREDSVWQEAAACWSQVKDELSDLQKNEEYWREKLIKLAGEKSAKGGGIKLSRLETRGFIDYEKVPQLKNVDLEPFRKPPIIKYQIKKLIGEL
jgi:putative phage-type endonuclease